VPFPRKLLTEDEEVLLDLRPHWKALVVPVFWSVVIWAVAGFLMAQAGGNDAGAIRIGIAVVAFIVWYAAAGLKILRWKFTEFVLTNERIIHRTGVISKMSKEIPLERVNDVTVDQSVLDRILGSGTITLESAGEYGQTTFDDIAHPVEVQKRIYEAAEARKGLSDNGPRGVSVADELAKLSDLLARGVITQDDFDAAKRKLLG
jgi:uncharacterized membrane protein YdbT with pleckstrin-like domain